MLFRPARFSILPLLLSLLILSGLLYACSSEESPKAPATETDSVAAAADQPTVTSTIKSKEQLTVTVTDVLLTLEPTRKATISVTPVLDISTQPPTAQKTHHATSTATRTEASSTPTIVATKIAKLRASVASVNVRRGPSIVYESVGFLFAGDEAHVLSRNKVSTWYEILTLAGLQGWVSASVTILEGDTRTIEAIEIATVLPELPLPTSSQTPPPLLTPQVPNSSIYVGLKPSDTLPSTSSPKSKPKPTAVTGTLPPPNSTIVPKITLTSPASTINATASPNPQPSSTPNPQPSATAGSPPTINPEPTATSSPPTPNPQPSPTVP